MVVGWAAVVGVVAVPAAADVAIVAARVVAGGWVAVSAAPSSPQAATSSKSTTNETPTRAVGDDPLTPRSPPSLLDRVDPTPHEVRTRQETARQQTYGEQLAAVHSEAAILISRSLQHDSPR